MQELIEFLSQPWHWSVSGAMLAVLMFMMLLSGERLGISSSFETVCSMSGLGKWVEHFDFDWKKQKWMLFFAIGTVAGGYLAATVLTSPEPIRIAEATLSSLQEMGVSAPGDNIATNGLIPEEIFNFKALFTIRGFLFMVLGGFFVGFGTRYASGCTSGHAISGLANLQFASLIAVIGFFIGGIFSSFVLVPIIMGF